MIRNPWTLANGFVNVATLKQEDCVRRLMQVASTAPGRRELYEPSIAPSFAEEVRVDNKPVRLFFAGQSDVGFGRETDRTSDASCEA